MTDVLTGLPNRRQFERIAERYLMDYSAVIKSSLLVLDIDHFKRINDEYGHAAGDKVIHHVAAIIKASTRPTDIVARIGGEEFAVLLPNTEPVKASEVAERIRKNVEAAEGAPDDTIIPVRISVGGLYRLISSSYEENFKAADIALYRAKRDGRNKVVFSDIPALAA